MWEHCRHELCLDAIAGRPMNVSPSVWGLTVAAIVALVLFDFFFHVRKAHIPTLREAATWSAFYVGIAILFGLGVTVFAGTGPGLEYFAGYVTEKALSVDNLFVFLVIIGSFGVPRVDQQKVLLFGIVFALIARTGLIFVGAALINAFAWIFYLFGLILLLTAGQLIKPDDDDRGADNMVIRLARRFLRTTDNYDRDKLVTMQNGKRMLTPMLLVMVAIGGTDILFALDSIPAIFGLTQNVYIVLTATAFSLLGLRQLYFLVDGLLDRLVYLHYGLAAILAVIGIKLFLHALHENNVPFVNDGEPVDVAEVSTPVSLGVIVALLLATTVASLMSPKGKVKNAIGNAQRHATNYLNKAYYGEDAAEREKAFAKLCAEEQQIKQMPAKYRAMIRREDDLMNLLRRAHAEHDRYLAEGASR